MQNKKIALNGFKALADNTRLKLFLKIVELSIPATMGDNPIIAENTASHLQTIFGLAKSTISHHLSLLKANGMTIEVKRGKFTYVYPDYKAIEKFSTFLNDELISLIKLGKYHAVADIYLKQPLDKAQEFMDYLAINGCKSIKSTKALDNSLKIYFKITGYNEPFYLTSKANKIIIYCVLKNIDRSVSELKNLIQAITKIY